MVICPILDCIRTHKQDVSKAFLLTVLFLLRNYLRSICTLSTYNHRL